MIALLAIGILDAFLRERCHVPPAAIARESVLYNVPVENVVVVGPEMAGGALVAQLAALCGERSSSARLLPWCDFAYLRKQRKSSGAKQQLEGPSSITERTPRSVPRHAIIVDDALSTGTSLLVRSVVVHAHPFPSDLTRFLITGAYMYRLPACLPSADEVPPLPSTRASTTPQWYQYAIPHTQ